jgi:hypothetical protein
VVPGVWDPSAYGQEAVRSGVAVASGGQRASVQYAHAWPADTAPLPPRSPPWLDRNSAWLIPAGVIAVTCLTFLPGLSGQFLAWDDDRNFLLKPSYRGLGWTQLGWMFTTFHLGPYQPLSWLTLGVDYPVWGMDPFGYRR